MTIRSAGICLFMALCCGCQTAAKRQLADTPCPADRSADKTDAIKPAQPESQEVRPVSHAEAGPISTPSGPAQLSLQGCVSLGLSENPDLIAQRQAEHVSEAALGVAETYPFNPFIQVQATPYQDQRFGGGPGTTYHYVLLMQTIQLAHQQQFREEAGAAVLNSTRWNVHQAELLNVAQTERMYFSVLYQRGLLELAKASHGNNRQLLQVLEKQLEAGQATAADVAMVRVDTRSTAQQVRLTQANYETALRDLKRQIGLQADDSIAVTGDLRAFNWRNPSRIPLAPNVNEPARLEISLPFEDEKTLVASRAAARPDVMAAHADVDTARANLCLATASKVPDLQIGPYYQRTLDGTSFLGFRAQMDIPVFNTGRPLELQRSAELNQRLTAFQQILRRAELEALAAWERYKLAAEAVSEASNEPDNSLPDELEQLEKQFVAGEVDVIRVMQARTSIIQNQRVRLDLLNELSQSAANLTAATGMPIEELLQ